MDAFTYSKVIDSLLTYGFIDPLTIRPSPYPSAGVVWQIIDGENRWRGGLDLGIETCPAFNLGEIDDQKAMKLTIVLNELRGQFDPREMSKLLGRLLEAEDPISLAKTLPFTDVALQGMIGLSDLDLDKSSIGKALKEGESLKTERERWVERVFRLTIEANGIVQQALEKAKDGEAMSDVQALEMVCADFLAGDR
jgi:ParB-like chromosome segregation protein Spo0J